ncbi:MAG: TSUP family transporter, partial [Desulfomonilaceae bacterium]
MIYLVYLVTGILAGIVGGLLGTGGCALMMPVIRFGFDFDPAVAVGTTLTAVVFTAASGAYQHLKMKNVDKETAVLTGYSGVLG